MKITTICSDNIFDARFWTDGKREAPMLPDQPWPRVILSNSELFWTDECEEIAHEEPWGDTNDFADGPFADEPAIEDYDRALETGIASSPDKECIRSYAALVDRERPGALRCDYRCD